MTEFNYFCWSEQYNDENSFQKKRYRIFNTQVTKEEYENTTKIYHKVEFDKDEDYSTRFQTGFKKMWDNLTQEQQQEYLNIPHFNWEGFTFITGVTPDMVKGESLTGKEVNVVIEGKEYTAIIK